jgi:hypothetical protein
MTPPPIDLDAIVARAGFGPLRRAELLLAHACVFGDIAKVGLRRPEACTAEVGIRSGFLAFVLRGGLPLRGRRLQLLGAFVEGRLDLGGTAIPGSLWFYRCTFDAPVLLDGARVAGSVTLAGCRLPGLLAEDCTIDTDLVLNAGCVVDHELRLNRVRIGGDLDGSRLDLSGGDDALPSRRALLADAARIGGDVRLADGFHSVGEVRFIGARVGGDFRAGGQCSGNLLAEGGRGAALVLDRIAVNGSVQLTGGFGAAGSVTLRRARIGGDVDATGASFDRLGDAAWGDGASLVLDRARIDGALVLRRLREPLRGASFVGARVGALADDGSTWGERLVLDGFAYREFGDGAPLDTVFRVDWLARQEPAHLRAQFRVQPWRRLIRVLRRMGHERRAGSIALQRERWLRRIGQVGAWAPPALRWLPRAGHLMLGVLAGHGHRPGRLLGWLVGVWLLCGGVYWVTAEYGAAKTAAAPARDAGFSPLAYSLDRLLPLLDLGAAGTSAVGPAWPDAVRWLGHAEATFGWIALLLLLASLAGWIDRDRRR